MGSADVRARVDVFARGDVWVPTWTERGGILAISLLATGLLAVMLLGERHSFRADSLGGGGHARLRRSLLVGLGFGAAAFGLAATTVISSHSPSTTFYFLLPFLPGRAGRLAEIGILACLQPVVSEMAFRGLVQRRVNARYNGWWGGVVGVVLFVAAWPFLQPLAAVAVGTAAATAYAIADSITAPIAANTIFMVLSQAMILLSPRLRL